MFLMIFDENSVIRAQVRVHILPKSEIIDSHLRARDGTFHVIARLNDMPSDTINWCKLARTKRGVHVSKWNDLTSEIHAIRVIYVNFVKNLYTSRGANRPPELSHTRRKKGSHKDRLFKKMWLRLARIKFDDQVGFHLHWIRHFIKCWYAAEGRL